MAFTEAARAAPAIAGSDPSNELSLCAGDNLQHSEPAMPERVGEVARRVLLDCLRQQVRDSRLYIIELEMIGVALSSGCIGTGDAMALLVDLDDAVCFDEPEGLAT